MLWARSAGAKKFIFTSTGGLCGSSDQPIAEDAGYVGGEPLALYFASKYSSELLLNAYKSSLPNVILRPFFVYGPGQHATMLIAQIVERVRSGENIQLQGAEGIKINPIYVSDCVRALERAGEISGSHLINLAGPEVVSLRRLCEVIGDQLGRKPVFQIDSGAKPNHVIGDIERMSSLLGRPRMSFAEGIADLLNVEKA